ncbi:S41 family peptidase [Chitinophaga arvensicola]|uniref:Peptidase family S41 n=1 Tax=Chitinophaga arvensicola TaxID=29529 RepID=A0A1I0NBV7_9BACT|nr:S41 family peptidase [Chitinophaga arvensicola]SEV98473.1 Peptidase family S41 [Chitinophaga arvensicola]
MKAIAVLLLLVSNTVVYAQECDCRKKFDSVSVYLRKNYVGFIDKVTPVTQQAYTGMLSKMRLQAATIKGATHCLLLVDRYLHFFRDEHLTLQTGYVPVKENLSLTPAQLELLEKQPQSGIAGVYQSAGYKVAVVKNLKGLRTYAAVILESPVPTWKPGDVLFELAANGPDKFDLIDYADQRVRFDTLTIGKQRDGLAALGWQKPGGIVSAKQSGEMPAFADEAGAPFFFRQINDSTGYLRLSSFDAATYPQADSVMNTHDDFLRRSPNLVIDVRNSGAGTDKLIERLRPMLYTQPVRITGADFFATPDNIAAWGHVLDEQTGKLPDEYVEQIRALIHQGDGLQGRLVSMGPDENMILPSPLPAPAKVVVLMNGQCNNTTEQFLLEAAQSQKVKLMGTPTSGALDYANVSEVHFSAPDFTIHYPVTRSRRVAMGQGIDNKGVQPVVKLNFHSAGWLEEVMKQF